MELNRNDIFRALKTRIIGQPLIEVHDNIDSTNRRAMALARSGAPEGVLILAETQTGGRGRLGRSWHSPAGTGLYFSIVLRPALAGSKMALITLAAGLGAAQGLGGLIGETPGLKWPNDLMMQGRKVAGILTEAELSGSHAPFAVLGLGLNVNLEEKDVPPALAEKAGSLLIATGRTWDRTAVLVALLEGLEASYTALTAGGDRQVLAEYKAACLTIGARVEVDDDGRLVAGVAVGVDDEGRLMVEPDSGEDRLHLSGGEVTLAGPAK